MKELVALAVTGLSFGVGLSIIVQASDIWQFLAGGLIMCIGIVTIGLE